jgi:drug/metabolite transporter (DMT)-like permease
MYRLAPIAIIIAAALWGLDGIVLRPSLYTLPVPLVVLIESSIVALLLTPFFIKKFKFLKNLKLRDWLSFFAVALFGGALGTMAITKALFYVNYANLSVVVLIQKLQPVFAITLAAILLKEKLQTEFYLWAGIALIGAYLMTFGIHLPTLNSGDKTPIAALFSLIAAISFGSSTVFSKRALKNVGFEMGTYLRFLISSLVMIFIVLSSGDYQSISKVSQMQWIVFLIIAFTTGGPAIFLYYYGLKSVPASVSAICELSFPLTAVLLEYFVHGNLLDVVQWIGVLLLLGGILKVSTLSK